MFKNQRKEKHKHPKDFQSATGSKASQNKSSIFRAKERMGNDSSKVILVVLVRFSGSEN